MKTCYALIAIFLLTEASVAVGAEPSPKFKQAMGEALQETEVNARLQSLWDLGSSLSLSEIPAALEAANELKELRERLIFLEATETRWGDLAPPDAFAYVAGMPESQMKVNMLRGIAAHFARKDPPAAAAAAAGMLPGAARNDALETVAHVWAQHDAGSAHAWAQQLPNDFAKEAALNAIRYLWVHSDPVAAVKHVEQLPPGQNTTNLISNVAYEWAARDLQAALQWARGLPEGSDKEEALLKIAESWANEDATSAASFAVGLPAGETRLAAAAMVASRWARQDPRASVEWSWGQKDSELRTRAVAAVLEVWAPIAPEAAGIVVSQLPAGPERDQFLVAYVDHAVMWAPDVVADRALLIEEPKSRARAVEQCLSRWREVDAAAAERWAHESDQSASAATPGERDASWEDLMVFCVQAQKQGDLARAESLVYKALELARRAEPLDIRVVRSQMLLGEIYRWQKNYAAAEALLQEAVANCEKIVGSNDPQLIVPLDSLANYYYYTDAQYEKVLPLYERLLRIVESDPELDQRDVAQRARNLGTVCRLLNRSGESETYFKSAIAQVEQLGPANPDLPQHLLTLAEFYRHGGRFAEAAPLAKRALAICGPEKNSLGAALSLDELAATYLAWGKPAEAEPLYARTLSIIGRIVGPDHADLAPRLVGLAESQRDQGKFTEAEANYQRALGVVERGLGSEAPELVPILQSYAEHLDKTKRTQNASEALTRARAIQSRVADGPLARDSQ